MNINAPIDKIDSSLSKEKDKEEQCEDHDQKNKISPIPNSARQRNKRLLLNVKEEEDDDNDNCMLRFKSSDNLIISAMLKNEFDKIKTNNDSIFKSNHNKHSKSLSNIQNELNYNLNKENNNNNQSNNKHLNTHYAIKTQYEASFLDRMSHDLQKRRTKEERMNLLIEKNKVKHTEKERIIGFNRLIDDANRRIEAKSKMDVLKTHMTEDNQITAELKKSYNHDKWNEIYKERFEKYQMQIKEKVMTMQQELHKKKQEDEEKVVEILKETSKKMPKENIDQMCLRLYENQRKIYIKGPKDHPQNNTTTNNNIIESSQANNYNTSKEIRSISSQKITTKQLSQNKSESNCLRKSNVIKTDKDKDNNPICSTNTYTHSHTKQDNTYKNIQFRIRTEYNNFTSSSSKVKPVKQPTKTSVAIVGSLQDSNLNDIEFIEKNLITSLTQSNVLQSNNKSSNSIFTNEIKQKKMNKGLNEFRPNKSLVQSKVVMRNRDPDKLVQTVFRKKINY